jgi:rhodanese-related sulfurtransferase
VAGDVQDVSPRQLFEMLQKDASKLVVLDVREPWEFNMGRVPDAVLIPLGQLEDRVDELDPDQPIAVICQHGVRSLSAAALLGSRDFKKIYNIVGGTTAWIEEGLPTERG